MQTSKTNQAEIVAAVPVNEAGMAQTARKVGVIALVPDDWKSVWMPRHQILSRLAATSMSYG